MTANLAQCLAWRWPSQCQVCARWPASRLCADCLARFAPARRRCERCAAPREADAACPCEAQADASACTACVAAVDYAFPWDRLMARFKFHGETGWARPFGELMRAASGAAALLGAADALVPVPLTPQRLAERGHHPPWALTQALARGGARVCLPDALQRLGESPAQHRLGRQQRLHNLRGLFAAPPQQLARLRGARLLLIDDVMTTGATLDAAAQALRAAGARRVDALVFARTPAPHERAA